MKKIYCLFVALMCVMTISAREVYLVGDATPANWDLGNLDKTQMTEVATDVFEWTGVLTATPTGEGFKILTQRDWNPGIHPSEAALKIDLAGQDVVRLPYNGDPDTKWQVSKTAEYTIRVSFRENDVLVECVEAGSVDVGVPAVDGVYQISTATEAANFAKGINAGTIENNCQVVLVNDLDLNSIEKWEAIGTDAKKFMGTFDGQGHRIKNMHIDGTKKEQGFFGVVGPGAYIKNTIVDASCTIASVNGTESQCMSAFAGCCNNDGTITFENCGNEANVTGTRQNNAAFVGCNYGGGCHLVFINCYNVGSISGGRENGVFAGWSGGGSKYTNCYNTGAITEGDSWARGNKESITNCFQAVGTDEGVTQIDAEKVASGELCFTLGEPFTQNIGEDAFPTFGHKPVLFADGEYYNEPEVAPWTPVFSADKCYTITNKIKTDAYWQDNGNGIIDCHAMNDNSYWVITPTENENCYTIKNADTNTYVQGHGDDTQVEIKLGADPAEYYIVACPAEDGAYGIASTHAKVYNFTAGCVGLNLKKDPNEEGCCLQTFAAVAGTNHRSFWLIEEVAHTSISNVAVSASKVVKTIENGQVVIIRNGVKYNIAGAQMK